MKISSTHILISFFIWSPHPTSIGKLPTWVQDCHDFELLIIISCFKTAFADLCFFFFWSLRMGKKRKKRKIIMGQTRCFCLIFRELSHHPCLQSRVSTSRVAVKCSRYVLLLSDSAHLLSDVGQVMYRGFFYFFLFYLKSSCIVLVEKKGLMS